MEISMSMRFVRIRSKQKAKNGPVYAEHTLSALLMLAGLDAQSVMPSGTDAARKAIAEEIADLREALGELYGIGEPRGVMARYDDLIEERGIDTGAEREFAAILTDAESWIAENPGHGDMVTPVAMLHAVHKREDMLIDEAMLTAGDELSGSLADPAPVRPGSSYDPEATVVDTLSFDPEATLVDERPDVEDEPEPDREAEEALKLEEEKAAERKREEEKAAERRREEEKAAERRREEEKAAERRREEEKAAEREKEIKEEEIRRKRKEEEEKEAELKRQAVEAVAIMALNQALGEANRLKEEEERKKRQKAIERTIDRKTVAHFIGFVIVVIAAWQVYLRAGPLISDEPLWWMKLAFFIVYFIAMVVSYRQIGGLQARAGMDPSRTTMMRIRVIGTAGMIYFRLLILSTAFPAILLLIVNLAMNELSPFWYHFFCIYVFCWMCGLVSFAFQSNFSALSVGNLDQAQLKKKKDALVGSMVSGYFTVPAIVFFLHWHFGWSTMKTWVIVLLIIYLVFGLFGVISTGRISKDTLQNEN